jgi:diaminopimelate epimerase
MKKTPFRKMHGLGNCFVIMDDTHNDVSNLGVEMSSFSRSLCDRNFGIGADGLILIRPSEQADFEMSIYNEDGSIAQMCGNGVRCFSRFVREQGLSDKIALCIQTLAGPILTQMISDDLVEVDMGQPRWDQLHTQQPFCETMPKVDVHGLTFSLVSMGNPHAVAFVPDFDFDWRTIGREVESFELFPNKTNVEFVKVISPTQLEVKVWERGCGETMACGTGACAVAVAGTLEGVLDRQKIQVTLPGGALSIEWRADGHVMMTGPAMNICEGHYWF